MKSNLLNNNAPSGYGTDGGGGTDHENISRQDSTESLGIDDVQMGDYDEYNEHDHTSHGSIQEDEDQLTGTTSSIVSEKRMASGGIGSNNGDATGGGEDAIIQMHPKARQYDFWLSSGSVVFWIIVTFWLYIFLDAANNLNSKTSHSDQSISSWESSLLIILPIVMYGFLIVYPLGSHVIFDPEVSRLQLRAFLCKRALQHLCIVVLPTACLFTMFVFGLLCEFSNGNDDYCGPGGAVGGIVMFFLGAFGIPPFWFSFLNVASYSGHFDQLPRFRIVIQVSLVVSIIAMYLCIMGPFMIWLIDTNENIDTGFSITDVFYQAIVGLFYFGMFCQAGLYITFHDTGAGVSLLAPLDRPIVEIPRWYLILLGIPICLSYFFGNFSVMLQGGAFFGYANGWSYFCASWTLLTGLIGIYVMYRIIIIYLIGLSNLKVSIQDIEIPSLNLDSMRQWHKSMLDLKMEVSDFSGKFQYMGLIIVTSCVFLLALHAFLVFLQGNISAFFVQILSLAMSISVLTLFLVYDMLIVNTMILEQIENVRDALVIAVQDDTIPSDMYMQLLSCVNVWKLESRKLCIDMYGFAINKTIFIMLVIGVAVSVALAIYKLA